MPREIKIIDRGRGPELAHIRITVYDIIPYLEAGHHHTYIAVVLGLSSREVLALMQYIEEHREEVMAVHRQIEERIARGNPPEIEAKRQVSAAKLRARMEELKRKRAEDGNGARDSGGH